MYSILLITLILGGGGFLFFLKQQFVELEQLYQKTQKEITETKESIHVLTAEWAYLNDPQRLQSLAIRYLPTWGPIKPTQVFLLGGQKYNPDPVLATAPGVAPPSPLKNTLFEEKSKAGSAPSITQKETFESIVHTSVRPNSIKDPQKQAPKESTNALDHFISTSTAPKKGRGT